MYRKEIVENISDKIGEGKVGNVTSNIEILVDKDFIVHAKCHIFNDMKAKTKKIDVIIAWDITLNCPEKGKVLKYIAYNELRENDTWTKSEISYFWPMREYLINKLSDVNYRNIYYQFLVGNVK